PLDERIDEIVLRALERERELRQKNATEFKTQIEHVASHPTPPGEHAGARGPHGTAVVATEVPKVVKRTAQVLLGVGIFNWIGSIVIVSLLLFTKLGDRLPIPTSMHNGFELLPILAFSSLIILGAFKMMRLEAYPLAIAASVLAMITTPGNLAGLPLGIFSLITLFRKDVRAAFAQRKRADGLAPAPMRGEFSHYSHKAIWAASLVGFSLLLPAFIIAANAFLASQWRAGVGPGEMGLGGGLSIASGLAGTILGWIALSDIRAHHERLRGLPLAAFGALAWPVVALLIAAVFAASPYIYYLRGVNTQMPLAALCLMAVAAGLPTFAIWMAYTTTRWASGQPATQRRGVLRWIFAALVLFGAAILSASVAKKSASQQAAGELEAAPTITDTNVWVRFTFTAVEFREEGEKRWLAFDYVDHKQGVCEAAFRYESTVVGFKGSTRKSSFLVNENEPPVVRHQRIEFRLPPSTTAIQGQQFRNDLKYFVGKSVKVDVGSEKPLFVLDVEGGTISGSIGAVRPLVLQ
ncbi:MAG TPA: hypothetical protein VFC26_11935, partial [Verrucomicrobiae bacterium]|nr:hypothetical protein [Verrucomicrobiae bacterium]